VARQGRTTTPRIVDCCFQDQLQDAELFIDVNALHTIKKQVKPISQQEANESRRLWKEVTAGLKFNDIDKATSAKQTLEQKQRDEAKERKEAGLEWRTKVMGKQMKGSRKVT
jgi:hypothetical protein